MALPESAPSRSSNPTNGHPALPEDATTRLLDRLDALERRLARLEPAIEALSNAPALAASAVDVADDYTGRLHDRGVDVETRLLRLLALAERLTDDRTMDSVEAALGFATDAPGLASMLVDIVDEQARQLLDEGIDIEVGLTNGARAALQFGASIGPREIGALRTLLASEALAPEAVAVVSAAAQALVECQGRERERVGPLRLFKELRDPDVQRALDFLLGVARRFGGALEAGPPRADVVRSQAHSGRHPADSGAPSARTAR